MSLTIGNSIFARRSTRSHAQVKTKNRHGAKIRSTFLVLSCSALLATGIIVVMRQSLNAPATGENGSSAKGEMTMESKADRRWEPIYFEAINKRARQSELPDLRTVTLGDNDLEVRVWIGFGLIPLEGIILRRTNGTWTAIHLPSIYGDTRERQRVKILPPPDSGWAATWNRLTEEGILTLPDSSELSDEVDVRDGESFVVETKTGDHYRTYMYPNPDHQKWDEAKRMLKIDETISLEFNLPEQEKRQRMNLSKVGASDSQIRSSAEDRTVNVKRRKAGLARVEDMDSPQRTDVFAPIPEQTREEFAKRLSLLLDYRRTERWDALYDLISGTYVRGLSRQQFVEESIKHPGVAGTDRTLINFSPKKVTQDSYVSGGFIVSGCARLSGLRFPVDALVLAARENNHWRFSDIGMLVPRDTAYRPCGYTALTLRYRQPRFIQVVPSLATGCLFSKLATRATPDATNNQIPRFSEPGTTMTSRIPLPKGIRRSSISR